MNRDELIKERKNVLDGFIEKINLAIFGFETNTNAQFIKTQLKNIFDAIFVYNDKSEDYTLFRKWIKINLRFLS